MDTGDDKRTGPELLFLDQKNFERTADPAGLRSPAGRIRVPGRTDPRYFFTNSSACPIALRSAATATL